MENEALVYNVSGPEHRQWEASGVLRGLSAEFQQRRPDGSDCDEKLRSYGCASCGFVVSMWTKGANGFLIIHIFIIFSKKYPKKIHNKFAKKNITAALPKAQKLRPGVDGRR